MTAFEEWLPTIRMHPAQWLAPVIRAGDADLACELIRDHPHLLHARFSGNTTPLLLAAYSGQRGVAERLLAMGAKMDFIAAVALGRTAAVRAMLGQEPRLVHKRSPSGWAAIHIAARYADAPMLDALVCAGADVNDTVNGCRLSPLFLATQEPFDRAELLLARGARIDARMKHGFTVLHTAAATGNEAFVKFLIAHGARKDIQTNARQTPWAMAVRYGHRGVVHLLDAC